MMLPITGASYTHASQDVNAQRCVNLFPTDIGPSGLGSDDPENTPNPEGIGKGALIRTPGHKLLIDLHGSECRGLFTINSEFVYTVVDSTLYQLTINEFTQTATSKTIGTIGTTSGPVKMRNNSTQLMIVDGSSSGYIYVEQTTITTTIGTIGGSAGNTYALWIQGSGTKVQIYNYVSVSTALTPAALVTAINLQTTTTGVTASNASGVVTLTNTNDSDLFIYEDGVGFVQEVNGFSATSSGLNPIWAGALLGLKSIDVPAFNKIWDPDFVGGNTLIYNDGYFLYDQPGTSTVWNSALNDGTTWSALEFFNASSKPCLVQGLAVNKGEVWVYGDTIAEVWFDNANASGTPYSYRIGSGMDIGCSASQSIVEMETINVWLDSRGFVCQSDISPYIRNNNSGYDIKIISTPALHAEWATYFTITDAIGTYYTDRGHIMYMITFPTAGKTWVYDFPPNPMVRSNNKGGWHERTYLNPISSQEEYCLSQYVTKFNQLNVSGGNRSGKIYIMSSQYYTDDGVLIKCTRSTAPFSSDFAYYGIDKLELRMQTGAALQTGQGSNPQIVLRSSSDGSHTWSDPVSRSIGLVGQYNHRVIWNRLGSAREWVFEWSVTEPIDFSLIKASVAVSASEDE